MATILERVQSAWHSDNRLTLHGEVERLAAEGHSRQALEDALEALLLQLRSDGADDDTEEIVHGVWDRLTGWCREDRQIEAVPRKDEAKGVVVTSFASPPTGTVVGR